MTLEPANDPDGLRRAFARIAAEQGAERLDRDARTDRLQRHAR